MPTHYSCSKGQILRIVFYCSACTVVKAFVASISQWLMHMKSRKECAVWGSVQTRLLGRGKASGSLLAQEAEEGKLISHYGRLLLDSKCSHKLWLEVCFSIWAAAIPQHWGPHQGLTQSSIRLLQWTLPWLGSLRSQPTMPLDRSDRLPGSAWLHTSYWWQPNRPYGSWSPMAELTSVTALAAYTMAILIHDTRCCLSLWDQLLPVQWSAFTNKCWFKWSER